MFSTDQAKVIQSRLSRKKVSLSQPEIKAYVESKHPDVEQLTPEQLDEVTVELIEKHSVKSLSVPSAPNLTVVADAPSSLTHEQQEESIQKVAKEIDIALPIEAIKSIAGAVNWVLADREQIRVEIRRWVDNKLALDARSSEEMFNNLETEFSQKLNENNQNFNARAGKFQQLLAAREDEFRSQVATILELRAG